MNLGEEEREYLGKIDGKARVGKKARKKAERAEENRRKAAKHCERVRRAYGLSQGDDISVLKLISVVLVKRFLLLCLIAVVVFVSLASYYYFQGARSATVVLSLNFEESSNGLAPNKTRFNIYDITSNEVMTKAIEYAGLTETLKPSVLSKNISITEVYTRSVASQDYYIATSYRINLAKPDGIVGVDVKDLLDMVCRAYKDYFFGEYTNTPNVLASDYSNTSGLEYEEIGGLFQLRTTQINRYLDMRLQEGSTFTSESTGETFKSLQKLTANLEKYNVRNYNAFVWEHGVVKKPTLYKRTLEYKNYEYSMVYEQNQNEYEIRLETIQEFNKAMTTTVFIPTIDSRSYFYMARTTSGIDRLAREGDGYLALAVSNDLNIETNRDKLAKLPLLQQKTDSDIADEMITIISTELDRICSLVTKIDEEYTSQKMRNYLTFAPRTTALSSQIHLTRVALISFGTLVIAYIAFVEEARHALKKGGF